MKTYIDPDNTFMTSDLHFHHKNIFKFCRQYRPYSTVEEMNNALIVEWNRCIKNKDTTIIHLGDFSFGGPNKTRSILDQFEKCNRVFIIGNHDHSNIKTLANYGQTYDYKELKVNGVKVILSHYPLRSWHNIHKSSVHFFGHCHGNLPPFGRSCDVGWDSRDLRARGGFRSLSWAVNEISKWPIKTPEGDHHKI